MRIYLKNISKKELELINLYPIHGVIFTITEGNAEEVRDIIKLIPPFINIIGEVENLPKYELEELMFFCKLHGIIVKSCNYNEELSCPRVLYYDKDYNSFSIENGELVTKNFDLHNMHIFEGIFALVFSGKEFLYSWPSILRNWEKIKVV